jgi:hypothetical protein
MIKNHISNFYVIDNGNDICPLIRINNDHLTVHILLKSPGKVYEYNKLFKKYIKDVKDYFLKHGIIVNSIYYKQLNFDFKQKSLIEKILHDTCKQIFVENYYAINFKKLYNSNINTIYNLISNFGFLTLFYNEQLINKKNYKNIIINDKSAIYNMKVFLDSSINYYEF